MKTTSILYRVRRPNQAVYFGVHDPTTRRIRTERTEQAARAVADEMNLELTGEQDVTHEQWLRLTGIRAESEDGSENDASKAPQIMTFPPAEPATAPPLPTPPVRFDFEPLDALVLKRPEQSASCFATDVPPVAPDDVEPAADEASDETNRWHIYRPSDP